MQTIKIGRTTYKLNDARDIYAAHAKCTGKHNTPYGPDVDVNALFAPLNDAPATVYTGDDTYEALA